MLSEKNCHPNKKGDDNIDSVISEEKIPALAGDGVSKDLLDFLLQDRTGISGKALVRHFREKISNHAECAEMDIDSIILFISKKSYDESVALIAQECKRFVRLLTGTSKKLELNAKQRVCALLSCAWLSYEFAQAASRGVNFDNVVNPITQVILDNTEARVKILESPPTLSTVGLVVLESALIAGVCLMNHFGFVSFLCDGEIDYDWLMYTRKLLVRSKSVIERETQEDKHIEARNIEQSEPLQLSILTLFALARIFLLLFCTDLVTSNVVLSVEEVNMLNQAWFKVIGETNVTWFWRWIAGNCATPTSLIVDKIRNRNLLEKSDGNVGNRLSIILRHAGFILVSTKFRDQISSEDLVALENRSIISPGTFRDVLTADSALDGTQVTSEKESNEKVTIEKILSEDVSGEQFSGVDVVIEKALSEDVAVEKSSSEEIAIEKSSNEEIAIEKSSSEEIAIENVLSQKNVIKNSPSKQVAIEKVSCEDLRRENVVIEEASNENVASENIASKNVEMKSVSSENVESEEAHEKINPRDVGNVKIKSEKVTSVRTTKQAGATEDDKNNNVTNESTVNEMDSDQRILREKGKKKVDKKQIIVSTRGKNTVRSSSASGKRHKTAEKSLEQDADVTSVSEPHKRKHEKKPRKSHKVAANCGKSSSKSSRVSSPFERSKKLLKTIFMIQKEQIRDINEWDIQANSI